MRYLIIKRSEGYELYIKRWVLGWWKYIDTFKSQEEAFDLASKAAAKGMCYGYIIADKGKIN